MTKYKMLTWLTNMALFILLVLLPAQAMANAILLQLDGGWPIIDLVGVTHRVCAAIALGRIDQVGSTGGLLGRRRNAVGLRTKIR